MSALAILLIVCFSWTTVALDEHILQYYDSEILVRNASRINHGTTSTVVSGAYATIGTPCNMVNCSVKSFRNNCNHFPLGLITSCYQVDCGNYEESNHSDIIMPGSAAMYHQCPRGSHTDGLVIPTKDVKQMIKRLSIVVDHKDTFSFPVIIVHYEDAHLLQSAAHHRVMFNARIGDGRVISYYVTPANHSNHSESSRSIPRSPFYYATLFLVLVLFCMITLVIMSAVGISVTWMCRKCAVKVRLYIYRKKHIKSYIKVMANSEQAGNDNTSHCCICLEDYKSNDVIGVLPCEHEYHKLCINKWLTKHSTCPLCKSDILMDKRSSYRHENPPIIIDREILSSHATASISSPAEVVEINFEVTEL